MRPKPFGKPLSGLRSVEGRILKPGDPGYWTPSDELLKKLEQLRQAELAGLLSQLQHDRN